jgi:hypothetical protein
MTHVQQVGGDHYKAEYQHWDWVVEFNIGYLEGNATKYMSRWRKKNGLQDLQKCRSYVEKIKALLVENKISNNVQIMNWQRFYDQTRRLLDNMDLPTTAEQVFMAKVATWRDTDDLDHCLMLLDKTYALASAKAAGQAMGAGQGQAAGAAGQGPQAMGAGQGQGQAKAAPQAATGAAPQAPQGATGQAPATSDPTAEQISRSRQLTGLEHPFGYDGDG